LYTSANDTLDVHFLDDVTLPSKSYKLVDKETCYSALIIDKRLYVGGITKLYIFEVNPSLDNPLTPVARIATNGGLCGVYKILRLGEDLILG
jgi:hypothetical protein